MTKLKRSTASEDRIEHIDTGTCHLRETSTERTLNIRGAVATYNGFVLVFAARTVYSDNRMTEFTELRFIWNDREYVRTWGKYYSLRYVPTLCRRFSDDVATGKVKESEGL